MTFPPLYCVGKMTALYFDAHCHRPLRPAPDGGGMVLNAITEDDWGAVIDAASGDNKIHGAIGIHPWYCATTRDGWDVRMAAALRDNPRLMVGEIGMDTGHPDIDMQRDVFQRQMKIAQDFNRAVHIHWIGAWDILPWLVAGHNAPVVMHSFAGSGEIMRAIAQKCDAYFSFGDAILNTARNKMRRALVMTPADKILVESDKSDPALIPDVITEIANLRGIPVQEMTDTIYQNSQRMLKHG